MATRFESPFLSLNSVGPKVDPTRLWTLPARYSALLRLVHPESPTDQEEVVIRRGDLITLSLDFLYKEPSIYISAKCADVPLTTHEEFPKPENGPCLALDMVVWDMNNGNGTYISAFCDPCHNTSSIPEAGVCGCLVRFHGRVSPIKDWKAKICFEFPIIKNEREEQKKYRIRILLRQSSPSPSISGLYELKYTFTVLSCAQQLQTAATPPIPAHVLRLLSGHALTEAIFTPICPPGPFDCTLAEGLGLDRHCLPFLSVLSSHKYREMTYRLSIAERQLISDKFLRDLKNCRSLIKAHSRELQSLQEQYSIARFITTLRSSIYYLPVELLADIFLIAVEQFGMSPTILQRVSRGWRALTARLWGAFRVHTWTEVQKVAVVINESPRSLSVVIDTAKDETLAVTSEKRYAALALAWTSTSRWRSLAINSFPGNASIRASSVTLICNDLQFQNLETLAIGPECDSSDSINEIMEAISSTVTPKLTSLSLAATMVFQQLNHSQWVRIYSRLTVMEVDITNGTAPVDFLRHCVRLEVLKLSGVVLHSLPPEDEVPLLQTLRRLWLRRASIQWMEGRAFERLESCTLLRLVDPHNITHDRIIDFPVCTSIVLQSRSLGTLAAFNAPMIDRLKVECNEWSKPRANRELGRVWTRTQRWNKEMLRPKVLSLNILCGDRPLLDALAQMVTLEELLLDLPHPSALGVSFFEAMCAVPMSTFTGRTSREWVRWAHCGTTWEAKMCPSLSKLKIQYARWLRRGETDMVTPLLITVAWSRENLFFPLQQLSLKRGEGRPLELGRMANRNPSLEQMWVCAQGHRLSHEPEETLYLSILTSVIHKSIGFVSGKSEFPFKIVGEQHEFPLKMIGGQQYGTFFCHLRAFHHRPPFPPAGSYNILPFFENLEELDVSNFHFGPCPPAANLLLCRTLRILNVHNTPLDWMDGRIFKRVTKCRISMGTNGHIRKLSRVEMPACKWMEFAGSKYFDILAPFHLPGLESLLLELGKVEESPNGLGLAQNITFLAQSIRPQVLQIHTESEDENLITALQSIIGKAVLIKYTYGKMSDFSEVQEVMEVDNVGDEIFLPGVPDLLLYD